MYNQLFSQSGFTQQANYTIRGCSINNINIETIYKGNRGVYGVVNIDKELNNYSYPYSLNGYSQSYNSTYDDRFKSEVIYKSDYEGFRYIFINYDSSLEINTTTISENFKVIEGSGLSILDLNTNYTPLNIVFGESAPDVTFTSSYKEVMRLISSLIKKVEYNNYESPYSLRGYSQNSSEIRVYNTVYDSKIKSSFESYAITSDNFEGYLNFDSRLKPLNIIFSDFESNVNLSSDIKENEVFRIIEDISSNTLLINSQYLPYIGGRLVFKGRLFSQDVDSGTI